jgi:hypothetical protein
MCKILGAQHYFKGRSQKTRLTNVRDIGDKAPFDKAPLEIRRQKTKRQRKPKNLNVTRRKASRKSTKGEKKTKAIEKF